MLLCNGKDYEAIIFDFDFTLADATMGIVGSFNYAFEELGIEPKSVEDIRKTVGMVLRDAFRLLTEESKHCLAEEFVSIFMKKADEIMTDNTAFFEDTISVLTSLKKNNVKTAIVTSKMRYRIIDAFHKKGISDLIDYVVGFEDVTEHKPSPKGIFKALDFIGADRERSLYVGDSTIDAGAAQNAGVDFAAVTTGTTVADEFKSFPHIIIANSLSQIFSTN